MIYLDYAATTPLAPEVFKAMEPFLVGPHFGNPSSIQHAYGKLAAQAVEDARRLFSQAINADAEEIIWTSGATEATNLALQGVANAYQSRGKHIISVVTEHKATLDTLTNLEKQGFEITLLPVNKDGLLDLNLLESSLRSDTILVSLMQVNNETGIIHDLQAISPIVKRHGALLHIDAVQSLGKVPLDVKELPIDLASFSAHKIYGPKGIGALFVRKHPRVKLHPIFFGGGQEHGLRPGTLAPYLAVGFATAAALAIEHFVNRNNYIHQLNTNARSLLSSIDNIRLNSLESHSVPHIINCSFPDVEGEALLVAICEKVAVASGSACKSTTIQPSHVLLAMGSKLHEAHASLRLSLSHHTTLPELYSAIDFISQQVQRLRKLNT